MSHQELGLLWAIQPPETPEEPNENRQVTPDGLLRQVKPEDLEQFGLIPEIIA